MRDQLEKAGFKTNENALLRALSLWRNRGGMFSEHTNW